MDFQKFASRLGMSESEFREIAELFISVSRRDLGKIKQGVATGSAPRVAAAAHSIKGAAANLGFDKVSRLARQMETKARQGRLDQFDAHIQDLEDRLKAMETW